MARRLTIALDGPAGSGKSTLARALAARLGYRYLDTGAMYRAVALVADRRGIGPGDTEALAALAEEMVATLRLVAHTDGPHVLVGDEDVSLEIRSEAVSRIVSRYARRPEVRRAMVRLQKGFSLRTVSSLPSVKDSRSSSSVIVFSNRINARVL